MPNEASRPRRWRIRLAALAAAAILIVAWRATSSNRPRGRLREASPVKAVPGASRIGLEFINEFEMPGTARAFHLAGSTLYASLTFDGLATFDVSDAPRPQLIHHIAGMIEPEDPAARVVIDVLLDGERLIVADRRQGIGVYDATDPLRPRPLWSKMIEGGFNSQPVSILLLEDNFYVSCGARGVLRFPRAFGPETEGRQILDDYHYTRQSVFYPPHYLLATEALHSGLQVVDIQNPERPTLVHHFNTGSFCDSVVVVGKYAVVARRANGFAVVDVNDPVRPFMANYLHKLPNEFWVVKGMALYRGRYIFMCNTFGFISIYDFEDPAHPTQVGHVQTGGEINAIVLNGDLVYANMWDKKRLGVFRITQDNAS